MLGRIYNSIGNVIRNFFQVVLKLIHFTSQLKPILDTPRTTWMRLRSCCVWA